MATESKAILLVEDEASMVEMLELALKKWGYRVRVARNLRDGLAGVERGRVDVVLSDIKLPDGSGVEILSRVNTLPERPPVIFMTAFGSTESAVQAMKLGATNYLTKPFKLEALREVLDKAVDTGGKSAAKSATKDEPATKTKSDGFLRSSIIGKSKAIKDLFEMVDRVAKTKTNILVTGESGTGKELVARAIHYSGILKEKPFIAVNCGAIPETLIESELFGHKKGSFTGAVSDKDGLFQVASGGTIFLDEVGELPMTMQVKLLRVLQDRTLRPVGGTENLKVDVRVISATNRDLDAEVAAGRFREDLFYRLNVIHIKTPPLRTRKDDIPLLIDFFLKKFSLSMGKNITRIAADAMNALMHYDYPGNVRELENIIERAIALEGTTEVTLENLPAALVKQAAAAERIITAQAPNQEAKVPAKTSASQSTMAPSFGVDYFSPEAIRSAAIALLERGHVNLENVVGEIEKEFILRALEMSGGVKKKAAELLGVTFRSMRYRIQKYGIKDSEGD